MDRVAVIEELFPVERVAAPGVDLPQVAATASLDDSRAQFREALNGILLRGLIGRWWHSVEQAIQWLARRRSAPSFVVCVIVLNLVALVASSGLSLWLGEASLAQTFVFVSPAVWTFFAILYIVVMHTQLLQAVDILNTTIVEKISSTTELLELESLIRHGMRIPWQFAFSLLFALVAGLWIPLVLSANSNVHFLKGAIALYVFLYFEMAMYIYFLLVVTSVLLGLSKFELDIYANDPSSSRVVRRIYRAANTLTFCSAALGALHYFIMLIHRVDIAAPFMLISFVVLGWLPPIGVFITAHLSLARMISNAKVRKLAQIQEMIRQNEQESNLLVKYPLESILLLMDYHDRIRATPNSMINLNSITNLIASLFLPLVAAILSNIEEILQLIGLNGTP